jgi:hypothetical protein
MKNLAVYYFFILLPLPLLIWAVLEKNITLPYLLILYFIYRGYIDGKRLISLGLIGKKDLWKSFIPFWKGNFFKDLYFKA